VHAIFSLFQFEVGEEEVAQLEAQVAFGFGNQGGQQRRRGKEKAEDLRV
jgi:hypothetical protein